MILSRSIGLRVSLVIPAYNEEANLADCLHAISKQTVTPFEVIVVDNNSTDNTVAVARSYPFVKLMRERRQGVAYARDRGFNAARGDIIGRLDADSHLASDWVAQVQQLFADLSVDAATGIVGYRDVSFPAVFNSGDRIVRDYLAKRMDAVGEQFLFGANMAVRRTSWLAVRNRVCHERRLHEDMDLAVHMSQLNQKIVLAHRMWATISPRQAGAAPRPYLRYVWSNAEVFKVHEMQSLTYIRRMAVVMSVLYLPIHMLYRGYNPSSQRFSISYAMQHTVRARTSPLAD